MAPDEQQSDPHVDSESPPSEQHVDPDEFIEAAPQTNGGETAPPDSFGVAGDPEGARERAEQESDSRGDEAPEPSVENEPAD